MGAVLLHSHAMTLRHSCCRSLAEDLAEVGEGHRDSRQIRRCRSQARGQGPTWCQTDAGPPAGCSPVPDCSRLPVQMGVVIMEPRVAQNQGNSAPLQNVEPDLLQVSTWKPHGHQAGPVTNDSQVAPIQGLGGNQGRQWLPGKVELMGHFTADQAGVCPRLHKGGQLMCIPRKKEAHLEE